MPTLTSDCKSQVAIRLESAPEKTDHACILAETRADDRVSSQGIKDSIHARTHAHTRARISVDVLPGGKEEGGANKRDTNRTLMTRVNIDQRFGLHPVYPRNTLRGAHRPGGGGESSSRPRGRAGRGTRADKLMH